MIAKGATVGGPTFPELNWKQRLLIATPRWSLRRDLQAVYNRAMALTRTTGVQMSVDHIVPLHHPMVCGLNVVANLQVITEASNKLKGSSYPDLDVPERYCWDLI